MAAALLVTTVGGSLLDHFGYFLAELEHSGSYKLWRELPEREKRQERAVMFFMSSGGGKGLQIGEWASVTGN